MKKLKGLSLVGSLALSGALVLTYSSMVFAGAVSHPNSGGSSSPAPNTTTTITNSTTNNATITTGTDTIGFGGDYSNPDYVNFVILSGSLPQSVLQGVYNTFGGSSSLSTVLGDGCVETALSEANGAIAGYVASGSTFYGSVAGTGTSFTSDDINVAGAGQYGEYLSNLDFQSSTYNVASDPTLSNAQDLATMASSVIGERQDSFTLSANQTLGSASYLVSSTTSTTTSSDSAGCFTVCTNVTQTTTNTYDNVTVYEQDGDSGNVSPIVLDMSGSGKLEASGGRWLPHPGKFDHSHQVVFDFFHNGFPVFMEWVGPHDGLLVEPKADGTVDGSCLFGTQGGWADGYAKLASRDANGDGKLTGDELKGLAIWVDANGNGQVDPGEVKTLDELGITEINVRHNRYASSFVMNGQEHRMWDWWPSASEVRKVRVGEVDRSLAH